MRRISGNDVTLGLNRYFDPNTKLIFTTTLLSAASPPQRASRIQHRPGHLPNERTGRFLTLVPSTAEWAIRMRPRNGSSKVDRPTTIRKMYRTPPIPLGTMAPSDSSVACSMGVWLLTFPTSSNLPSKRGQLDLTEVSRFSCRERPHMPGSMTPPNPVVTRVGSLPLMLPSPATHRVGIRDEVISELNSPPVLSPVNASPRPRGSSRHDSGPE